MGKLVPFGQFASRTRGEVRRPAVEGFKPVVLFEEDTDVFCCVCKMYVEDRVKGCQNPPCPMFALGSFGQPWDNPSEAKTPVKRADVELVEEPTERMNTWEARQDCHLGAQRDE